ncbi:hypothetical protein AAHH17_16385 [Lysinibacillus capsici]|uniref:hypothetical protein n=1 Tax=Lysinibacillus capsici TaxID=2115968 RepID=UPI0032E3C9E4
MEFKHLPARWEKGNEPLPDFVNTAGWKEGTRPSATYLNWHPGTFYEAIKELQEKVGAFRTVNGSLPDENGDVAIDTDMPGLLRKNDLEMHKGSQVIYTSVHGLRVKDGFLQYLKDGQWVYFSLDDYSFFKIDGIRDFKVKPLMNGLGLTWIDPNDRFQNEILRAAWSHTVIVRKTSGYPERPDDGTVVVSSSVRNQYSQNDFVDVTVKRGTKYYYSAFVYSDKGIYTAQNLQEATLPLEGSSEEDFLIYGIEIDEANPDPQAAVRYIEDSQYFIGGVSQWEEKFPFNKIRPVYLVNGEVVAELDKNDFSKDINGNVIDITGTGAGDVAIEFPKIYWNITKEGTKTIVRYSPSQVNGEWKALAHTRNGVTVDHIYIGAYLAKYDKEHLNENDFRITRPRSTSGAWPEIFFVDTLKTYLESVNVDKNYTFMNFYHFLMLQILFYVRYKTLDSTAVLGTGQYTPLRTGVEDDYFRPGANPDCGVKDQSGMISPSADMSDPVKFLGIENIYGLAFTVMDGIMLDGNHNFRMGFESFDKEAYTSTIPSGLSEGYKGFHGYLSTIQGTTELGFLPKETAGSSSTYYEDHVDVEKNHFITFGGLVYDPTFEPEGTNDEYYAGSSGMASTFRPVLAGVTGDGTTELEDSVASRMVYTPGVYEYEYPVEVPIELTIGAVNAKNVQDVSINDGNLKVFFDVPNGEGAYQTIIYSSYDKDLSEFATAEELMAACNTPVYGHNETLGFHYDIKYFEATNERRTVSYMSEAGEFHPRRYLAFVTEYKYKRDESWAQPVSYYTEPIFFSYDVVDTVPPNPLISFTSTSTGFDSLTLAFLAEGSVGGEARLVIVQKEGSMPTSQADGIVVYDDAPSYFLTEVPVSGLTPEVDYYFRAFIYDKQGNLNDKTEQVVNGTTRKNYVIGKTTGYPSVSDLAASFSADGLHMTVSWKNPTTAEYDFLRTDVYVSTEDIGSMTVAEVLASSHKVYSGVAESFTYSTIAGSTYYVRAFSYYTVDEEEQIGTSAKITAIATDTVGPGVLSDFKALGMDETRIFISWVNPTAADFASTKIVYKANSEPFSEYDGTVAYEGNGTSQVVNGLAEGVTYHFRAFTKDLNGNVTDTNDSSMNTSATPNKAEMIDDLTLTQNNAGTEVYATWTRPTSAFLSTVELFVSESPDIASRSLDQCRAADTIVFEGLSNSATHYSTAPEKTYHYKVFAVYNFFGTIVVSEGYYNFIAVQVADTTPPRSANSFTATAQSDGNYLTWDNPSDTDFDKVLIARRISGSPADWTSTGNEVVYEGKDTSFLDVNVVNGTSYTYRIWTFDVFGNVDEEIFVTASAIATIGSGSGGELGGEEPPVEGGGGDTGTGELRVLDTLVALNSGSYTSLGDKTTFFPVATGDGERINRLRIEFTVSKFTKGNYGWSFAGIVANSYGYVKYKFHYEDGTSDSVTNDLVTVNGELWTPEIPSNVVKIALIARCYGSSSTAYVTNARVTGIESTSSIVEVIRVNFRTNTPAITVMNQSMSGPYNYSMTPIVAADGDDESIAISSLKYGTTTDLYTVTPVTYTDITPPYVVSSENPEDIYIHFNIVFDAVPASDMGNLYLFFR